MKVGDRLGWRVNNRWKEYSKLTFSIKAPEGAFPTFWGGERRKLIFGFQALAKIFSPLLGLVNCKI
ncbi:GUN4 domain-containing protein [Nostoc sp.]|uniref:GUN4 domain-containing protein n=1 Tax=Nostoc sp. TaxID=1180 RepID=UPI003FA5A1B9